MMIDDSPGSGSTGSAPSDEEKILRTTIPARYRLQLHREKVMSGKLIKDLVQEALAEYLGVAEAGADGSDAVEARAR